MAFQIVRNDITKISADAIVNTANPEPVYKGGTDAAIYTAAGADRLLAERRKIGRIAEGDVAVTPAFDLDAKYIFHTVGPVWQGGVNGEKETVKNCYINCLNKALELGIESIAFPLIATGVYGFPKAEALQIATSVFSSFLAENDLDITLVVFDNEAFALTGKIFAGVNEFIDEHYVQEKTFEEYSIDAAFGGAFDGMPLEEYPCEEEPCEELPFDDAPCKELPIDDAPCGDAEGGSAPRGRERRRHLLRNKLFSNESMEAMPPERAFMAEAAMAVPAGAPMAAPAQRSLDDVVKNLSETWSEGLLRMITEKGYTDVEVYRRANVDRKLFSKIRSNKDYKPKKSTAVAFALALKLNLDETKDFIGRAGYAFSPSSKFDLIVEYFIGNGVYDFMTINMALFEHNEPLLG